MQWTLSRFINFYDKNNITVTMLKIYLAENKCFKIFRDKIQKKSIKIIYFTFNNSKSINVSSSKYFPCLFASSELISLLLFSFRKNISPFIFVYYIPCKTFFFLFFLIKHQVINMSQNKINYFLKFLTNHAFFLFHTDNEAQLKR